MDHHNNLALYAKKLLHDEMNVQSLLGLFLSNSVLYKSILNFHNPCQRTESLQEISVVWNLICMCATNWMVT